MNLNVCKWCVVPMCTNTSIQNPNKLFVYVPRKKIIRDKWLKLARRDPAAVVRNLPIYICEDHFDMPNDMENYMQYHVMGRVSKICMKPGCIPTKFECQIPDKKKPTSNTVKPSYFLKKRRKLALEEYENQDRTKSSLIVENFHEITSESSGTDTII